jgi:hypothetical protein
MKHIYKDEMSVSSCAYKITLCHTKGELYVQVFIDGNLGYARGSFDLRADEIDRLIAMFATFKAMVLCEDERA